MRLNAIVTGGAGFIGAHLVRELISEGVHVRVIERPGAPLDNLASLDVQVITADIGVPGSLVRAIDGCDVLFHLAANPRLWARDRNEFQRTNYGGTKHVLEAAAKAAVPRVVYTSTESIIGPSKNGDPCNEETPARAEDMVGKYCLSKFLAEEAAREAALAGSNIVIVNPTIPVGPGDINRSPGSRLVIDFLNGRLPAIMDCALNIVDVRDIARGHILAWRRGVSGRRYILGHENVMLSRLLQVVGDLCGKQSPRVSIPYGAGLAVAYASEFIADYITGREPAATVTGVRLTRRMNHLDCSRAVRELGFEPGDVRIAIADAVNWFYSRGWIRTPAARQSAAGQAAG